MISVLDEHVIIMRSVIKRERDFTEDDIVSDKVLENELRGEISEIDVIQGESSKKSDFGYTI